MSSSSSKVFKVVFFHGALYCCLRYSNVKMKILKLITKSIAQKVVAKFGFGRRH